LDIFGFEDFAHNTFEQVHTLALPRCFFQIFSLHFLQLCINYANEKLHSLFVDAVLKTEQVAVCAREQWLHAALHSLSGRVPP
jgi:myosin heavy subunit